MSYYTYFKLKKDSKYKDWDLSKYRKTEAKDWKNEFYVQMIQAYYDDNPHSKVKTITNAIRMYIWDDLYNSDQEYLKQMFEDEDKELWRNHCQDEWDMKREVEDWDENLNRIVRSLIILATVRFVPDDRYSDTPKTVMDYLQYDYINKINEELGCLEEYVYDYTFAKFVTEHCIRRNEDQENYPDEIEETNGEN